MRFLLILFSCESTPFNYISFQSSSKARKRAKLNGSECAFDELNIYMCIYVYINYFNYRLIDSLRYGQREVVTRVSKHF